MSHNVAHGRWTKSLQTIRTTQAFCNHGYKLNDLTNDDGRFHAPTRHMPFESHSQFYAQSATIGGHRDSNNGTEEELNSRRLQESKAKLKASSVTSEVLAGFALSTMVELQLNYPTAVPEWLFVYFAVNTTLTVSLNIFSIMISTYLIPSVEAAHRNNNLAENTHGRMKKFIETSWILSNILGLFLFMIQLTILCWVKFWDYSYNASLAGMIVVIPFLVIYIVFAGYFYHISFIMRWKKTELEIKELERINDSLDSIV